MTPAYPTSPPLTDEEIESLHGSEYCDEGIRIRAVTEILRLRQENARQGDALRKVNLLAQMVDEILCAPIRGFCDVILRDSANGLGPTTEIRQPSPPSGTAPESAS